MRLRLARPLLCAAQRRATHTAPLQVLGKEHEDAASFQLDLAALKEVFEHPQVADRPACVVSVAGAMRTGKSFLLDQMLQHLNRGGGGFHWRGGMARDTSGLHLWPSPLLLNRGGEEVAVFLMDTQGTFDHKTTVRENMTVFALSTMVSSVLVYNLQHGIREDHLQHLQLFTEYGRLALQQTGTTPFQKLQFLVRDWHYPHDAPFGAEGGKTVLDRLLATEDHQPQEIRALREHIINCFADVSCCLLPYPGPTVAEDPAFRGAQDQMEPRFATHLGKFVSSTLAVENLQPKVIGGKTVRAREMVDYFQRYIEIFNGDEIPEPKSIFNTTAEVTNMHALGEAKDAYLQQMEGLKLSATSQAIVDRELADRHKEHMQHAVQLFQGLSKFGGEEFSRRYHEVLVREIQEKFDYFKRLNDSKIRNTFYQSKEGYIGGMEAACGRTEPLHQQGLADLHLSLAQEATRRFQRVNEANGSYRALSEEMLAVLVQEINAKFVIFQGSNDGKIRLAVYQAVDTALERYSAEVEAAMEGPLTIHPIKLECQHKEAKKQALESFSGSSNYGTNFVACNSSSLARDIDEKFAYYRELNASKKLSKRLLVTLEQLSDNSTYREFWRSPRQQQAVGGGLAALLLLRILMGS